MLPRARKFMKPSPPTLAERIVLVLGPLFFFAMLYVGYRALIGPSAPPDPIEILRKGTVGPGTPIEEALTKLGRPNSITTNPAGNDLYRFERTRWSSERKTIIAEDAFVEVDADQRIASVNFESREPPVNPTSSP